MFMYNLCDTHEICIICKPVYQSHFQFNFSEMKQPPIFLCSDYVSVVVLYMLKHTSTTLKQYPKRSSNAYFVSTSFHFLSWCFPIHAILKWNKRIFYVWVKEKWFNKNRKLMRFCKIFIFFQSFTQWTSIWSCRNVKKK